MLAVVLAEEDSFFRAVSHRLRLRRFAVVRYRDPVKLSDNLPELKPDLLVVRAEDFPLHWEVLASQIGSSSGPACPLCLVVSVRDQAPPQAGLWPFVAILEEAGISGSSGPGTSDPGRPSAFSVYLASLARPGGSPAGKIGGGIGSRSAAGSRGDIGIL